MLSRIIIATKHNSLRNGLKTSLYWSISEIAEKILDDDGYLIDNIINLNWNHSKIPKKIRNILETSEIDLSGFSLKQSKFEIHIKKIDEDGNFEFNDIIDIKKIK